MKELKPCPRGHKEIRIRTEHLNENIQAWAVCTICGREGPKAIHKLFTEFHIDTTTRLSHPVLTPASIALF